MISMFYVSISAVWICWLALQVVKARRKNSIKYGDGGIEALQVTRSAHSNATETIPIALLLLLGLEFNGANIWLVHALGSLFIVGRILHGKGILSNKLKFRILGMQLTVIVILALACVNLIYLPYGKLM